jgi:extradiol dioxygenase family protein
MQASSVVYIFVYVKDLAASRKFYGDQLGLSVLEEDDSCVKFDAGGVILALNRADDYNIVLAGGHDDTSITVFHTDGVGALRATLENRGVEFSGPTQRLEIGETATFYDPDGHCYSLFQPSGMAMALPIAKKIRTIVDGPLADISTDGKVRGVDEEKLAGDGLGGSKIISVSLFVSDRDKTRKFYAEKLQLPILEEAPHAGVVKYDAGGLILATQLIDGEDGVRVRREDLRRAKNMSTVFHVENARSSYDRLVSLDVPFSSRPSQSIIGITAQFQDPEGHTFYLYQPSEQALRLPSGRKLCEILGGPIQIGA